MGLRNKRTPVTFTISEFYCTKCGNKGVPIPRKASRHRERGHLKKLFCLHCKDNTNHVEIRPFDYDKDEFLKDFKDGKFKEELVNEQTC